MSDDSAKKTILSRRARFVAAAMMGAGAAGCSSCTPEPCLSATPITAPPPTPCLSVSPLPCLAPPAMPPDAGDSTGGQAPDAGTDAGARPPPPPPPPRPCLSVLSPKVKPPPQPCLQPPRPKPCLDIQ